jgi:uncharacterized glyoxalase superfamily protein PhnB
LLQDTLFAAYRNEIAFCANGDAHIGVVGATSLHDELQSRGALITKPLEDRPWSCRDFYVEDIDGYILCFSEPTT